MEIQNTPASRNALRRESLPSRRPRKLSRDPDGSKRRAAIYVAQLAALRFETLLMRCRMESPRNVCRRELLAIRLEATDTRAADIAARLSEARL